MGTQHVGIGQVAWSKTPGDKIDMLGLGSCVGIYMFSGDFVCAAHCLLARADGRGSDTPGKFVETAIPHLVELAGKNGVPASKLKASIAGGAQIFAFSGGRPELEIGALNIAAALEGLAKKGIRIDVNDTGGDTPRRASMVVGENKLAVVAQTRTKAA